MAKGPGDKLVINIRSITENGLAIGEDLPGSWLALGDPALRMEDPVHIEGRVTREGKALRLKGSVKAELVTSCVRCGIENVHCPVESDFEIVYLPREETDLPEERELSAEELDESYYEGETLDLNAAFREQVTLEIPAQPLCKEDCAGLCARCGCNLNEEKCDCEKEDGDPRLAALKGLKIDD